MTSGSTAITNGVRVDVEPMYLPQRSSPADGLWMHAYTVVITNEGPFTVKLRSRHWVITNNKGVEQHVRGPGVVGEQPLLGPGESFEYTSGCPLDTPMGTMHGSFQVEGVGLPEGFEAGGAPFTLTEPYALN